MRGPARVACPGALPLPGIPNRQGLELPLSLYQLFSILEHLILHFSGHSVNKPLSCQIEKLLLLLCAFFSFFYLAFSENKGAVKFQPGLNLI